MKKLGSVVLSVVLAAALGMAYGCKKKEEAPAPEAPKTEQVAPSENATQPQEGAGAENATAPAPEQPAAPSESK